MAPPRQADGFIRGFSLGAVAVASLLGPDWLAAQLNNQLPSHANPGERGGHFADLVGVIDLLALFAGALLGPLGQWFTFGWLVVRLFLMLGVVAMLEMPLGAFLRSMVPAAWTRRGSRGMAQSHPLGMLVTAAILFGSLIVLLPVADATDVTTPSSQAPPDAKGGHCRPGAWRAPWDRDCDAGALTNMTASGLVPRVPVSLGAFATAFERLRNGRPQIDPLSRLVLQCVLGLLLVPASLLGDAIAFRGGGTGRSALSSTGQARLRLLIDMVPVGVAAFAALPTGRILVAAWEIRFRRVTKEGVHLAQLVMADELDALADLLYFRGIAQTVALLLRAALLRPDAFYSGLRILRDDVNVLNALWPRRRRAAVSAFHAADAASAIAQLVGKLGPLIFSLILTPLAIEVAAVSRALASAPPTHLFWHATAVAVEGSTTDRWLMVLLPSAAIGVRLLADGATALLPQSSIHRRRILSLLQLSIELLHVQQSIYPAFLFLISPLLYRAGFRGTGSLHLHTTLSLPTIPPRSAVLCLLPSLFAAAARYAELGTPGAITNPNGSSATQQRDDSPSSTRSGESFTLDPYTGRPMSASLMSPGLMSPNERLSGLEVEVSESDSLGVHSSDEDSQHGRDAFGERWSDVIAASNWWLRGAVHLIELTGDGSEEDDIWPLFGISGTAVDGRSMQRLPSSLNLAGGKAAHRTAEEWVRRQIVSALPAELRDMASRFMSRCAACVSGNEMAGVRDSLLAVLSELFSQALSFKLLTRTGRRQLRRGIKELLAQQHSNSSRPPEGLRLDAESLDAFCEWLDDPAIGIGGVLRPPPEEVPPDQIQPPSGSEHDVDYSKDTIGLLLGGKATRPSKLSLFLDLAGGTFFHIAGLQLRVSINEREATAGTSGLQCKVRWQSPSASQRRRGRLGALRIDAELEQPERVTLHVGGLSIFNAALGSMPLKGPVRIAGRGGRLRAAVVLSVEGGAELASCPADELSEHVREHGGGVYLTLEKLRLEDSGFELDEASKLIWDDLLSGSGYLLQALRFLRWNLPLVAVVYPKAKAAWSSIANTWSAVTGNLPWNKDKDKEGATSPTAVKRGESFGEPGHPGLMASPSLENLADAVKGDEARGGAGQRGVGVRLLDDILRLIGDASCANTQNLPIMTYSVLEKEAPELCAFLSGATRRQEARDARHAQEAARARRFSYEGKKSGSSPNENAGAAAEGSMPRVRSHLQQMWNYVPPMPAMARYASSPSAAVTAGVPKPPPIKRYDSSPPAAATAGSGSPLGTFMMSHPVVLKQGRPKSKLLSAGSPAAEAPTLQSHATAAPTRILSERDSKASTVNSPSYPVSPPWPIEEERSDRTSAVTVSPDGWRETPELPTPPMAARIRSSPSDVRLSSGAIDPLAE